RAAHEIESLDTAHRRGLEPDTLNFANAAATEIEIWTGGRRQSSATVRRSGLNGRTLTPPQDDELGRGGRGAGPPAAGAGGPAPTGAPAPPTPPGAGGRGAGRGANPAAAGDATPAALSESADAAAPPVAAPGAAGDTQGQAPEGGAGFGAPVIPIPAKTFDLATAYTIDGWFGDTYVDLLPDRLETAILVGDAKESLGAAHIATRLGLETTGVTLPLARSARRTAGAAAEPNPILVGRE